MFHKTMIAMYIGASLLGTVHSAKAHFGMVIPSENIVTQKKKSVALSLSFSHPFEGHGMDLSKPEKFYVTKDGEQTSLLGSLQETTVMDHQAWRIDYKVKRPGVYIFAMEPKPYWEPSEDVFIIHYTKTIIAAFGSEEGWDSPLGLPTEIVPLLRPFGNYMGNSFSGTVMTNGTAVPGAEVEVEMYNQDNTLAAPSDYHITQVVKADSNGVFSFTCPQAGWWGFAALSEADYTLNTPEGEAKHVELGAVLWVYMDEYLSK